MNVNIFLYHYLLCIFRKEDCCKYEKQQCLTIPKQKFHENFIKKMAEKTYLL